MLDITFHTNMTKWWIVCKYFDLQLFYVLFKILPYCLGQWIPQCVLFYKINAFSKMVQVIFYSLSWSAWHHLRNNENQRIINNIDLIFREVPGGILSFWAANLVPCCTFLPGARMVAIIYEIIESTNNPYLGALGKWVFFY